MVSEEKGLNGCQGDVILAANVALDRLGQMDCGKVVLYTCDTKLQTCDFAPMPYTLPFSGTGFGTTIKPELRLCHSLGPQIIG